MEAREAEGWSAENAIGICAFLSVVLKTGTRNSFIATLWFFTRLLATFMGYSTEDTLCMVVRPNMYISICTYSAVHEIVIC